MTARPPAPSPGNFPEEESSQVMIVDDTPANLKLMDHMLRALGYWVFAFSRGDLFLRAAAEDPPDLVLLDIDMPGMDGFQVCRRLKEDPALREIPVIFLSALSDPQDKVRAFETGGVDYMTKPFDLSELKARIETHLRIRGLHRELERVNRDLETRVAEQVREISDAQLAMILALAKLAEYRDDETGTHLDRVRGYCHLLAERAASHRDFREIITPTFTETLTNAGPLHDIGKVGIEDRILRKPGLLSPEEFEIMKRHPLIGAATLESVRIRYPRNPLVDMGILITRSHHERWDGSGYPDGLAGEGIPLAARIMAVVDVYDALRSERCYKPAYPRQRAKEILAAESGTHFDPRLVRTFLEAEEEFSAIFEASAEARPGNGSPRVGERTASGIPAGKPEAPQAPRPGPLRP